MAFGGWAFSLAKRPGKTPHPAASGARARGEALSLAKWKRKAPHFSLHRCRSAAWGTLSARCRSFETLGDEPSQILDIVTPAGLWDFFSECGEPAAELRVPDAIRIPENLPEIVARYGGAVVGPPLNRPALALGA